MQLANVRTRDGARAYGIIRDDHIHFLTWPRTLAELLASPEPFKLAEESIKRSTQSEPLANVTLLAPVDEQEIWAAGVTYRRSKVAREEESVGAAQFYDKVYSADRPELFLKATASRVVSPGMPVRIRKDATWNVPEPELALVVSPAGKIVGYTIGNDMSSRDIEGENPLYLPQAKIYDGSCALGPVVTLAESITDLQAVNITLVIRRAGAEAFRGVTNIGQMARSTESLVDWLTRELTFPDGVILLTGTGIVPPDSFTLASGDEVSITIDHIGTLVNPIA